MKEGIEWQVSNLELSKKLKKLGVKQESIHWWVKRSDGFWALSHDVWEKTPVGMLDPISAFTVAELGEMLPAGQFWKDDANKLMVRIFKANGENKLWWCELVQADDIYPAPMAKAVHREAEHTEANARAKMLIYLIENKLIHPQ